MANTYTYRVNQVKCNVNEDDLQKVVKQVDWTIEVVSPNNTFVDGGFTTFLPDADPENFIDFETLYNDTVIEWVKSIEGEDTINEYISQLDDLVYKKENPTQIYTKLNIDPSTLSEETV